MELDVAADQPPGPLEQWQLIGRDEGGMGRGQAVIDADLFGCAQQRQGQRRIGHQQARAGCRGERRGNLQLGVIAAASPMPGIGPGVIENIFALAVALEIGR